MKVSEVKEKLHRNDACSVEIMRNPANLAEWVIWIREPKGKSFLLADESDGVITTEDVNECLWLLKSIGVKQASIAL